MSGNSPPASARVYVLLNIKCNAISFNLLNLAALLRQAGEAEAAGAALAELLAEPPPLAYPKASRAEAFVLAGLLALDGVRLNGPASERLPGNVNVSFRGADSESLLLALDLQGVAASSGSACTSGSLEPSHVLAAIGLDPETAAGTLRFSLGRWTTTEEVDAVLAILPGVVEQVRSAFVA